LVISRHQRTAASATTGAPQKRGGSLFDPQIEPNSSAWRADSEPSVAIKIFFMVPSFESW
jgi:hypothetical protein